MVLLSVAIYGKKKMPPIWAGKYIRSFLNPNQAKT
jgi:hypothetical protein